MKYTRFEDVPQFTRDGAWECDYDLEGAWKFASNPENKFNLDPDFQRAHVWTEDQQIAWLEFFCRGGKTGRVLYFNHPGWMRGFKGEAVIVDGKQRLESIRRFIHNEIPVFGSYFREFTDSLRILRTVKINVNTLQTRSEVLQWYIDFNAGGVAHTDEEIGRVRKLLKVEQSS